MQKTGRRVKSQSSKPVHYSFIIKADANCFNPSAKEDLSTKSNMFPDFFYFFFIKEILACGFFCIADGLLQFYHATWQATLPRLTTVHTKTVPQAAPAFPLHS